MFYQKFIRDTYNEAVRLHPSINSELKLALKSNERVPTFVDALAKEVEHVQDVMLASGKEKIKDETIKHLVYDLTNLFITGIENQYTIRQETDAARLLRQQAASYQRDLDSSAEGNLKGDFADIFAEGVIESTDRKE